MPFNHYAKIKKILADYPNWYVIKINQPTKAKNFKGETKYFDHYYRVIDENKKPIKYCKFQQIDRFARTMNMSIENIIISD